jgi:hypothetical protein
LIGNEHFARYQRQYMPVTVSFSRSARDTGMTSGVSLISFVPILGANSFSRMKDTKSNILDNNY